MTYPAIFIGGPLHGMRAEDGPCGAWYEHWAFNRSIMLPIITHLYRLARMQRDRRVWLYHGTKCPTPGGG